MLEKIKDSLPICVFLSYFGKVYSRGVNPGDGIILAICAMSMISLEIVKLFKKKAQNSNDKINNSLELLVEDVKNVKETAKKAQEEAERARGDIAGIKMSRVLK